MAMYKDLVYSLPEERDIMEKLTVITDDFVESIKVTHPQKYNAFMDKVKGIKSSNHFSKDNLEEVYKNGHLEEHYKLEDTNNYAQKEFDIDFSKESFNQYDLNYMMNYHYSVYKSIYNNDINKLAELTLAWLDQHDGKAMWYHNKLHS